MQEMLREASTCALLTLALSKDLARFFYDSRDKQTAVKLTTALLGVVDDVYKEVGVVYGATWLGPLDDSVGLL
jgi:hypothetical protein